MTEILDSSSIYGLLALLGGLAGTIWAVIKFGRVSTSKELNDFIKFQSKELISQKEEINWLKERMGDLEDTVQDAIEKKNEVKLENQKLIIENDALKKINKNLAAKLKKANTRIKDLEEK